MELPYHSGKSNNEWYGTVQIVHKPLLMQKLVFQILGCRQPECLVHSQWKHPHSAEPNVGTCT